jgi:hypothetical protein
MQQSFDFCRHFAQATAGKGEIGITGATPVSDPHAMPPTCSLHDIGLKSMMGTLAGAPRAGLVAVGCRQPSIKRAAS